MFQPRNTLVEVEIIDSKEKKFGNIVIPDNSELYAEGIVRSVGPGNLNVAGARVETHDLRIGQRVLVKRYDIRPHGGGLAKNEAGIRFILAGKTHLLFEQTSILAILDERPSCRVIPAVESLTANPSQDNRGNSHE